MSFFSLSFFVNQTDGFIFEMKKKSSKPATLLDKIEECDRGGQYELNISGLGLVVWPQETVLVSSVKKLNVEKNQLTVMPSLEHFRGLLYLNLSRNELTDVSLVRFGTLLGLKSIDLSRNQLTTIPTDLTRLPFLEELHLQRNRIRSLPDGMGNLRSLRDLDMSFNCLVEVGDGLEQLPNLENVNFLHNLELDVEKMGIRTRRFHEKVI